MPRSVSSDSVIVSRSSFESDEPYDIVESNIGFVNALLEEHVRYDEIATDALRSYFVDYYLAQVENGGFSQFVYNSRWARWMITLIREGLQAMGAGRHLALFKEGGKLVAALGPDRLDGYFQSEYFGENTDRDELNAINDRFFKLAKVEDLIALNAAWLRKLPGLAVMEVEEMRDEARRRGAALPDRSERIAAALENEPRFKKLIRALCKRAGQELSCVTAGDSSHVHEGRRTLAWHFLTDRGHHYMIEADGKAIMFENDSHRRVCEVNVPQE
jgi:hypothetical protein